jgi:hypothetical protein
MATKTPLQGISETCPFLVLFMRIASTPRGLSVPITSSSS